MDALADAADALITAARRASDMPVDTLDDARELRRTALMLEQIAVRLADETRAVEQMHMQLVARIAARTATTRARLEEVERRFGVRHAARAASRGVPAVAAARVRVVLAEGIETTAALYARVDDVPLMQYGAVVRAGAPHIVYRYAAGCVVGVGAVHVVDFMTDNMRTLCCGNGARCEYADTCRYFHDQTDWPDSTHTQRFMRTGLVKKCPTFAHAPAWADQSDLGWDALRTLARYCAVMQLMISIRLRAARATTR